MNRKLILAWCAVILAGMLACSLFSGTVKNEPTGIPTVKAEGSGFIESVTMAKDVQGEEKNPVDPTTVFSPEATFHAVVALKDAPANTLLKATWYATDVKNTPKNTLIDSYEVTTEGTRNIDFTLEPNSAWPAGDYRVEIGVNGSLDQTVAYQVQ